MVENFNCDAFYSNLKKIYGQDKEFIFDGKWMTIIKKTETEIHTWLYEVRLEPVGESLNAV